jgi:hypothetical protein
MEALRGLPLREEEKEKEHPLIPMSDRNTPSIEEKRTDPLNIADVVDILMESAFYFDLKLKERHSLTKHVLEISSCKPGLDRNLSTGHSQ